MGVLAAYDAYADWYEEYVWGAASEFNARVAGLARLLLGPGEGPVLDVCCGTGGHARTLRSLGFTPIGVDLSIGQLRYATGRLPVARADASALPIASGSVPAVACVLAHTDVPDYAAVVREAARVLRPGGLFVHIGVHPCFCGAFADRSDATRIVVDAGYRRLDRRFDGWYSPEGVRARVGAWHLPLPALLMTAVDAGLRPVRFEEAGPAGGVPDILGFAAVHEPAQDPHDR
jgi:SAM-dependent methyltransferase